MANLELEEGDLEVVVEVFEVFDELMIFVVDFLWVVEVYKFWLEVKFK